MKTVLRRRQMAVAIVCMHDRATGPRYFQLCHGLQARRNHGNLVLMAVALICMHAGVTRPRCRYSHSLHAGLRRSRCCFSHGLHTCWSERTQVLTLEASCMCPLTASMVWQEGHLATCWCSRLSSASRLVSGGGSWRVRGGQQGPPPAVPSSQA